VAKPLGTVAMAKPLGTVAMAKPLGTVAMAKPLGTVAMAKPLDTEVVIATVVSCLPSSASVLLTCSTFMTVQRGGIQYENHCFCIDSDVLPYTNKQIKGWERFVPSP